MDGVERVEQPFAAGHIPAKAKLGHRIAGELHRDGHRRNEEGDDEDDVLRHLGVGDALHAAEHGIDQHDGHADDDAPADVDLQEARKDDADAAHLPGHIGEADDDGAKHRRLPRPLRIVAVANEIGHGELAELAQVGRQQQGQQNEASGPAHQIDRPAIARKGDDARHADEAGRAHPVGGGGHAVGQRRHAFSGDIELTGGLGAAPNGDADVERKAQAHHDERPGLDAHSSSTPNLRSRRAICHT